MRQFPPEFMQMVENDIQSIEIMLAEMNMNEDALKKLHRELDGKYQACIQKWDTGMYNWYKPYGFSYEYLGTNSLVDNLELMKAKLTTYKHQMNAVPDTLPPSTNVTVNVDNAITVQVSFEAARKTIEDNASLTQEQTKEVLEKIAEIEKIVTSKDNKKTKWEKAKPILAWIGDKSVDVGIALLPLLLMIQ